MENLQDITVSGHTFSHEKMNELYNIRGLSMREIANELNIKQRTVESALKQLGITKNWHERIPDSTQQYQLKEVLENMLASNNASQIGKKFGVHARTITYWIKKHGIPFDKKIGYAKMERNQELRRKNRAEKRARKYQQKVAKLKFPGRGKGRKVSMTTKLKSAVTNVYLRSKAATREETALAGHLSDQGIAYRSEVPIAFFKDGRFISAYRVDYFIDKSEFNGRYSAAIALDGIWQHRAIEKNLRRDKEFNVLAPASGLVTIRLWNSEIDLNEYFETSLQVYELLRAAKKCEPSLVRRQIEHADQHKVSLSGQIESKSTQVMHGITYKIIDKTNYQDIIDQISRGEFMSFADAMRFKS